MTALVSEKLGVAFLHVPRTGGTAIAQAMREMDADVQYEGFTGTDRDLAELEDRDMARVPDGRGGLFTFCFVRHPYTRILSLYRFMRAWPDDAPPMARMARRMGFGEFTENIPEGPGTWGPQTLFVRHANRVGVFEQFAIAWKSICSVGSLPHWTLPVVNASAVRVGELTEKARGNLFCLYRGDFEMFGYER